LLGAGLGRSINSNPQSYPQILWIVVKRSLVALRRGAGYILGLHTIRRSVRVFAIIQAAGWPIWPLLFASIVAVALIIERLITLRRSKILPRACSKRSSANCAGRRHPRDDQPRRAVTRRSAACWPPACATCAARAR
jgi:hypothetical protein